MPADGYSGVTLRVRLSTSVMAPGAASPDAMIQFEFGTSTRSSGPTRPHTNWMLSRGAHPAGFAGTAPWGAASASRPSSVSIFIDILRSDVARAALRLLRE